VARLGLVLNEGKADVLPNEAVDASGRWHTAERKNCRFKSLHETTVSGFYQCSPLYMNPYI
jgi:hypothetical protein